MTVMDATTAVLTSPNPAHELRLVDNYIATWNRLGKDFLLPQKHAMLAPLIESFSNKPKLFLKYVRAVRDDIALTRGLSTMDYKELQELVRTLDVRMVQQQRRERLRAAVDWLSREQPWLTVDQQKLWVRRIEQMWARQRLAWLAARRNEAGGRLSESERRSALDEFWQTIENNINNGALPLYE